MFGTGTCIGVVGGIRITAIVVTLTFLAARGCTPRAASVFGAERAVANRRPSAGPPPQAGRAVKSDRCVRPVRRGGGGPRWRASSRRCGPWRCGRWTTSRSRCARRCPAALPSDGGCRPSGRAVEGHSHGRVRLACREMQSLLPPARQGQAQSLLKRSHLECAVRVICLCYCCLPVRTRLPCRYFAGIRTGAW